MFPRDVLSGVTSREDLALIGWFALVLSLQTICDGSLASLEMKDLFIERRSHSAFDLVREFFNRTLLPSCDFTANACDINCCNDKDCNDENLEAFSCTKGPEPFSVDSILSDLMYCHNNGTSSILDPILCYETENSPFLGVYFLEDEILKRKMVEKNLENFLPNAYFLKQKMEQSSRDKYKYGVPLRFAEEKNVVSLPREILGKGYCDYFSPIRFVADTDSICTCEISPALCVSDPKFRLETYFKEIHGEIEPPNIYSGGDGPLATNVTVQCGHDIFEIDDFFIVNDVLESCGNATKIRRTEFDDIRQVCEHVVTRVEYHFTWHGNALVALDILVGLSEISTARPESHVPSRKGRNPRVSQIFKTKFHQKETGSMRRQSSYEPNDEILLHHWP